jgi:drug/metabolite transporter (DMT)-like permease
LIVVVFGVLMSASSVLLIKASTLAPGVLAAGRLLFAALILVPFWLREIRRQPLKDLWASVRPSILPGVFLGFHFIGWNAGARATLAGNATLVVNMAPLVMPFLAWGFLKERLTAREIGGTALALLGLVLLAWGDYHFSPEHLIGDGLCFLAMVLYTIYILLARKRAQPGALLTYLVPLYLVGGVVCFGWASVFEHPLAPISWSNGLLLAGLVLGPTLIGHSIANWAMTFMRAQTVSLINLTQFVFAGILAFFVFGEIPGPVFLATAALVAAGAAVALSRGRKSPQ